MSRFALALVLAALAAPAAQAETVLDYGFFKRKVEPVFLKKRADHARCAVCHQLSNNAFRLEKLPEGASFWTEEQSKKNFATVSTPFGFTEPLRVAPLSVMPVATDVAADGAGGGGAGGAGAAERLNAGPHGK